MGEELAGLAEPAGPDVAFQHPITKQRRQRDLVRQLEHLTGQKVTFTPRPDLPTAA